MHAVSIVPHVATVVVISSMIDFCYLLHSSLNRNSVSFLGLLKMGDDPTKKDASTEESPFPLTELDKWILAQKDEEFKSHDWEDLKRVVGESLSRRT